MGNQTRNWVNNILCLENSYKGHGDAVDQLVWHPTNPLLFATASGDKTVRIWDVRTAKAAATINTKGSIKSNAPQKYKKFR